MKGDKIVGENYKWIVAGLCFLIMFAGLGFCSSTKNAYFQPITEFLGFSRSAFGLSDTFRYATTALTTMFFHRLMARFGTKKLLCTGLACFALSTLVNAISDTLTGFYIGGIVLGLGVTLASSTMVSVIINRWFTKNTGTVLGVILAANAAGSAVAITFLEPLIYSNGSGYKNAYFITSVAVALVLLIVSIFYKDKKDNSTLPNTGQIKKQEKTGWDGFEYGSLKRNPAYYMVIVSLAIYSLLSASSITTPYYKDIGFEGDFIALTLSIGYIGLAVSKILVGILYDCYGIKITVNICLLSSLISKLLLFIITPELKAVAIFNSVLIALSGPLETIMISIIVLDLFGRKCFNQALALTTSIFTIGQALNSPLLNIPYDLTGNYMISFIASALASIIVITVLNLSITSLKKEKNKF